MEEDHKPLVVVYDWCIPRTQFQEIIPSRTAFAKHIFACIAIKNKTIRSSDWEFFSYVAVVFGARYPKSKMIIVTQDQKFLKEVECHTAYETGRVEVYIIAPCNSREMNRKRAEEVACELEKRYGVMR